jgi:hypothetical protein
MEEKLAFGVEVDSYWELSHGRFGRALEFCKESKVEVDRFVDVTHY